MVQRHDVQLVEHRIQADEHGRDDGEKYFATSLAIENVVSAPRVISSCLPISTTSVRLGGVGSRSTMLPASGRLGAGIHRHPDIGLRERGCVIGPVTRHGDQPTALLFALGERKRRRAWPRPKSMTPASCAVSPWRSPGCHR